MIVDRSSRQERKSAAEKHIREMEQKYGAEIGQCVTDSTVYTKIPGCALDGEPADTDIRVYCATAQDVLKSLYKQEEKTCLLNFASYKNPGGGYLSGSMAQEESLCSDSFLYNVLGSDRLIKEFYGPNQTDTNHSLYRDKAVYSPGVLFFGKYPVDVLTCAAPNIRAYKEHAKYPRMEEIQKAQKNRIRLVLSIAKDQKADTLILGAFGCGVFGNAVEDVSGIFAGYLMDDDRFSHAFSHVYFAVPDREMYRTFNESFERWKDRAREQAGHEIS
jgi:uncharacterized protein (TIGR02452 family)